MPQDVGLATGLKRGLNQSMVKEWSVVGCESSWLHGVSVRLEGVHLLIKQVGEQPWEQKNFLPLWRKS